MTCSAHNKSWMEKKIVKTSAKCTILKNSAKTLMAGKYYFAIMTLIFSGMLTLLFNRFTYNLNSRICLTLMDMLNMSENSPMIIALSYVLPLVMSIVLGILQIGMCLFFLNIVTGRPFYTFDLLYGYLHEFGKSFRLSGVLTLLSFVCFLPFDILLDIYQSGYRMSAELLLILASLQLVLLLIYVPVSLALSQAFYVYLDYPDLSATEILKMSMKIMKGKKRQLFYVRLSFLPLFLLVLVTFGLGLFWFLPYYHVTMSLYYLDLMKPQDPS